MPYDDDFKNYLSIHSRKHECIASLLIHICFFPGIVMNTLGGFMYTYTKYKEGQKKAFHKDENFNKVKADDGSVQDTEDGSREELTLSEIKVS